MDVNGNDNSPEWGWCPMEGCKEEAIPFWFTGDPPDDPDTLLCLTHAGRLMGTLTEQLKQVLAQEGGLRSSLLDCSESRDLWKRRADALPLVRAAFSGTVARLTGYDWNADPDGITKLQGDAFAALKEADNAPV